VWFGNKTEKSCRGGAKTTGWGERGRKWGRRREGEAPFSSWEYTGKGKTEVFEFKVDVKFFGVIVVLSLGFPQYPWPLTSLR